VILSCTILLAACLAQNRPTLRRTGPAEVQMSGELAGFRPIRRAWPAVPTGLPDGTRVSVDVLVQAGRPAWVTADSGNSPAEKKAAEVFAGALRQWRFRMPRDGTSPVRVTVTWEARNGAFKDVLMEVAAAGGRANPLPGPRGPE
jgi:hypothetical protein